MRRTGCAVDCQLDGSPRDDGVLISEDEKDAHAPSAHDLYAQQHEVALGVR